MGSRLTLKTTPPERLVLASWAIPSLEGLGAAERKRFYSLKEAITGYVHGARITRLLQAQSIWCSIAPMTSVSRLMGKACRSAG